MRLPQLTTRRLMVLVAMAGIVFALLARRERLLRHAQYHADRSVLMPPHGKLTFVGDRIFVQGAEVASVTPRRQWHTRMWFKYLRAARHPWLPVPSDPTPPE